jgi:multicomponent Na+:H+ antiporter subunit F
MIYGVAALGLLVAMLFAIIRALLGPTLMDRVMAANMFGTKTVLLLAVLGYLAGRPEFLDLALVYALINFVGIIAVLKYFRYRDLGQSRVRS